MSFTTPDKTIDIPTTACPWCDVGLVWASGPPEYHDPFLAGETIGYTSCCVGKVRVVADGLVRA